MLSLKSEPSCVEDTAERQRLQGRAKFVTELLLSQNPTLPGDCRQGGSRAASPSDNVTLQWRDRSKHFDLLFLRHMKFIEGHDEIFH